MVPTMSEHSLDWKRVGQLLRHRREHVLKVTRQELAARNQMSDRPLADLEHARRINFRPVTIAAFERAYEVAPGAIAQALAGGDLTPANEINRPALDREYEHPEDQALWEVTEIPEDRRRELIRINQEVRLLGKDHGRDMRQRSA